MSMVKVCDICGKRIDVRADPNYRLEFLGNGTFFFDKNLDICEKCIKTIKRLSLKEENGGDDLK